MWCNAPVDLSDTKWVDVLVLWRRAVSLAMGFQLLATDSVLWPRPVARKRPWMSARCCRLECARAVGRHRTPMPEADGALGLAAGASRFRADCRGRLLRGVWHHANRVRAPWTHRRAHRAIAHVL